MIKQTRMTGVRTHTHTHTHAHTHTHTNAVLQKEPTPPGRERTDLRDNNEGTTQEVGSQERSRLQESLQESLPSNNQYYTQFADKKQEKKTRR